MLNKSLQWGKGFSLIEVLVVMVVMSILVSVAMPVYTRYITNAKATEAPTQMQALIICAQTYIRAHPNDWSQSGMLLGADATGTASTGDGDWVEDIVSGTNVYFEYDYDLENVQIRAWGKASPFDAGADFSSSNDRLIATLDNTGNVTWSANGRLQEVMP